MTPTRRYMKARARELNNQLLALTIEREELEWLIAGRGLGDPALAAWRETARAVAVLAWEATA